MIAAHILIPWIVLFGTVNSVVGVGPGQRGGLLPVAVERSGLPGGAAFILSGMAMPVEQRLSVGATHLLKRVRRKIRSSVRGAAADAGQWVGWLMGMSLFVLVGLLAPLLDWQLARTWRQRGFRAFWAASMLALAVYVRLLVDGRVPALAKWILVVAIIYAGIPRDLIADTVLPIGVMDDCVAAVIASRCFLRLCPNRLVEEHARTVLLR